MFDILICRWYHVCIHSNEWVVPWLLPWLHCHGHCVVANTPCNVSRALRCLWYIYVCTYLTLRNLINATGMTFLKVNPSSIHFSGTTVAQWLRCCTTNRKVASSIPAGVSEFFIDIKSFRSHYGPWVDSASTRNEYQESFVGVKAAVA